MTKSSFIRITVAGLITALLTVVSYEVIVFARDAAQVRELMITPHERNILKQFNGDL